MAGVEKQLKIISNLLAEAKFEVVNEGIRVKYTPTEEDLKMCENLALISLKLLNNYFNGNYI